VREGRRGALDGCAAGPLDTRHGEDRGHDCALRRGAAQEGEDLLRISSYGYDFRLSDEFKVPCLSGIKHIDPKKIDRIRFEDRRAGSCLIPPNTFVLGRSLEYFKIPRGVLALCQGKSTYARCGVIVNVTPLEPEWEGYITISLANVAPVPVKVYAVRE